MHCSVEAAPVHCWLEVRLAMQGCQLCQQAQPTFECTLDVGLRRSIVGCDQAAMLPRRGLLSKIRQRPQAAGPSSSPEGDSKGFGLSKA